ncbi:unnamed protein product, partial [Musa textilis]
SITNGVRFLRSAWLTGPFLDSDRHATQLYLTVGKEHGTGVGHRRRLPHSPSDRGFETLGNRGRKRISNPFRSVISDRVVRLDEIKELYCFR